MALKKIFRGLTAVGGRKQPQQVGAGDRELVKIADLARGKKDWPKAAHFYAQHLRDSPEDFSIWVQLGHALKESGDFGQAIDAYHRAMKLVDDDADLHLSFGHLYKVIGDTRSARSAYTRSFEINGNTDAASELAEIGDVQLSKKAGTIKSDDWSLKSDLIGKYFDIEYYLNQIRNHSILPCDAARHYLQFGSFMFLDPSPYFSTRYYLEKNSDLEISAGEAFIHYTTIGVYEGRKCLNTSISVASQDLSFEEEITMLGFDETYYRSSNNIQSENVVAIKHFVNIGWKKGLNPNSKFDVEFYLSNYEDVRSYPYNPLMHFLQIGQPQGRFGKWPDNVPSEYRHRLNEYNSITQNLIDDYFDPNYYSSRYVDISTNKIDPMSHFLIAGASEFRDPNANFDTKYYCDQFPGVQMFNINPLVHYALIGKNISAMTLPASKAISARIDKKASNIRETDLRVLALSYTGTRHPLRTDVERLHIHWVIPEFAAGGGGHMTIFRMVKWLEFFGHRCTLWVINPEVKKSQTDREEIILKNYQMLFANVFVLRQQTDFGQCDCLIATSWDTAFAVSQIQIDCSKYYFIQDYEPSFYPVGSKYLAAKQTYGLGLAAICASSWLQKKMVTEHNAWARDFVLCADENYRFLSSSKKDESRTIRIAFYAREHTTRRAVELGIIALEILASRDINFIVDFFGTEHIYISTPFEAHNWGIVDARTLSDLYQEADIGVCFSATNYSLVPQEMMACGLPVVELLGESTECVFPNGTVTLAEPDPAKIADAIQGLIVRPDARRIQAQTALNWISGFSWEKSARDVERAITEKMLENKQISKCELSSPIRVASLIKVSVVIPTYNAGNLLKRVIDEILAQKTPWLFELVVIDSGSTDGTLELLKSYKEAITLIEINKSDFQHGRTRNLGVERSRGQYIAFLTQDALPANSQWLYPLVTALERYPQAAGAFGRHFAWDHASAFTKRDMKTHFDSFLKRPVCMSKYSDIDAFNENKGTFKSELHFYSDNNSCLRRDVWSRINYPEVDYGEDQLWASLVTSAGYGIVYVNEAAVYHSHDYDEVDTFKRARTEADFFRKWFGYELAPKDLKASVGLANAADERWGLSNGIPQDEIEHQKRLNVHRIAGLAAGSFEGIDFKSPF